MINYIKPRNSYWSKISWDSGEKQIVKQMNTIKFCMVGIYKVPSKMYFIYSLNVQRIQNHIFSTRNRDLSVSSIWLAIMIEVPEIIPLREYIDVILY
jgi:hypothetical protein